MYVQDYEADKPATHKVDALPRYWHQIAVTDSLLKFFELSQGHDLSRMTSKELFEKFGPFSSSH